eukprot:4336607-Pyramimonas_sp.AAC.2
MLEDTTQRAFVNKFYGLKSSVPLKVHDDYCPPVSALHHVARYGEPACADAVETCREQPCIDVPLCP